MTLCSPSLLDALTSPTISSMMQFECGLNVSTKTARKSELPKTVERAVPWTALVQIVEPHCPHGNSGRPPLAVAVTPR